MSQVEFVAVIATMVQQCRIEPVVHKDRGETRKQAEERIRFGLNNAESRLTLQLRQGDDVGVRWVRR